MFSEEHILSIAREAGFETIHWTQTEKLLRFASMLTDRERKRLREENRRLSMLLKRIQILSNTLE